MRPCQNSNRVGIILYPPQQLGRGIWPLENLRFISSNFASRSEREVITLLCWDTHAPSLLSFGRVKKYFRDSIALIFSTLPRIFSCRSRPSQRKLVAIFGFCASSFALLDS